MTAVFYIAGTLVVVAVLAFVLRTPIRKFAAARGDRVVSLSRERATRCGASGRRACRDDFSGRTTAISGSSRARAGPRRLDAARSA